MSDYAAVIAHLDAISRRRALRLDESLQLERAIKEEQADIARLRRRRRCNGWRPEEDAVALEMSSRGMKRRHIAERVPRSRDAISARLRYLRKHGEAL